MTLEFNVPREDLEDDIRQTYDDHARVKIINTLHNLGFLDTTEHFYWLARRGVEREVIPLWSEKELTKLQYVRKKRQHIIDLCKHKVITIEQARKMNFDLGNGDAE